MFRAAVALVERLQRVQCRLLRMSSVPVEASCSLSGRKGGRKRGYTGFTDLVHLQTATPRSRESGAESGAGQFVPSRPLLSGGDVPLCTESSVRHGLTNAQPGPAQAHET